MVPSYSIQTELMFDLLCGNESVFPKITLEQKRATIVDNDDRRQRTTDTYGNLVLGMQLHVMVHSYNIQTELMFDLLCGNESVFPKITF